MLRVVLGLVALGLLAWAVARRGPELGHAFGELHPWSLVGAAAAVLVALAANTLSWRALLAGLGSPLPVRAAGHVFLLGQLGKYLPGSVWALVAQVDLGRDYHVPARRGTAAAVLNMHVNITVGIAFGAVGIGLAETGDYNRYWWLLLVLPLAALVLYPPVLRRLISLAFRLTRRPAADVRMSGGRLLAAIGWAAVMWMGFGVQIWLLALDVGASGATLPLLATGAYAAAWIAGFVVLVAPAGAGAREVVLTVVLATVLPRDGALAVALVARGLSIFGDFAGALYGFVAGRAGTGTR